MGRAMIPLPRAGSGAFVRLEQTGLGLVQAQTRLLETAPEHAEQLAGVRCGTGDDPPVVDPPDERRAGAPERLVAEREHGVRQDGRRRRPDRQAADALGREVVEDQRASARRPGRHPGAKQCLDDDGRFDRLEAARDVGPKDAGVRRPEEHRPLEASSRRAPRAKDDVRWYVCERLDAVRDDLRTEVILDARGDRNDRGRVVTVEVGVQTREHPDATGLGHQLEPNARPRLS
jgi:hypothetical protein